MKTFKLIRLSLLSLFLVLGMIACGGNNNPDPDDGFTVTLSSSSTNVTAAGEITLTATATGGTLASVQFQKDGANLGNLITAAPFTFQVELNAADNGTISFTALGTDSDGNTDTSDAVTVTVNIPEDNTAPTVSLASSASTVTVAGNITLTATASDDVGVARVEFFKNGNPLGGPDFTEPFTFQAGITQSDNGDVSFTAKAFDDAGNEATSSEVTVTINISVATLLRPSKSSTISISGNNNYIVQSNPENDTVSIFTSRVLNGQRQVSETAEVFTGADTEPAAVVIHPDDEKAYVSLRGTAEVIQIDGINTLNPSISNRLQVGSEPTGIALSPSGNIMVITEFAESRVAVIDTTSMTIRSFRDVRNPRAVAITNDGDTEDTDEKVVVTEFYGEVIDGSVEGQDDMRNGIVRVYTLGADSISPFRTVSFPPVAVSGFEASVTSPNQLYSVAITPDNSTFMVTATAASPFGPPGFNRNIFQLLLIGEIETGNILARLNISEEIKNQVAGDKLFMADIVDLATVGNNVVYLASRGADAFQRLQFEDGSFANPELGSGALRPEQVDLLPDGCQAPIGVVVPHDLSDNGNMYINCWVSRNMAVVDLAQQATKAVLEAGTPPSAGEETDLNKGLRFYFTGRARWSNESWSSCGSCHPDGLSDNITWQFPAGPRQTVSMDGSFSKSDEKQRIFNWTGVFDELHDFERNTRNVSGGIGAIVFDAGLDVANRLSLDGFAPVGKPIKDLQDGLANDVNGRTGSVLKDWDEIDLWSKTIRPPLGQQFPDASVADGRTLFGSLGCASCHGGSGWTVSRRYYTPSVATNDALTREAFDFAGSPQNFQIEAEPVPGGDPIAPPHVSCVLRNVGTFGAGGENGVNEVANTDELEIKLGNAAARAQGEFSGYNVPSLYGLQLGAPYLHHGQAKTLEELLDPDGEWQDHLEAGNPNFKVILDSDADLDNLVAFLLSIDASTPEFDLPDGSDLCPVSFP